MSTDLTIYDTASAVVADLVKKDAAQEFDHTTEQGEKDLRSWVHRIKGGCGDIEKARKGGKAGLLEIGKKIDDRAKELTAPLREIQATRMKPLDEIAAKEAKEKQDYLDAKETKRAEKADADAKELKELRAKKAETEQADREAKIAVAAGAKALQDAKDEQQVKENARIETERLAKIESDRLAQAEQKRIADKQHRKEVEGDVWEAIDHFGGQDCDVTAIVEAIKDGKIPHVTINY